MPVKRAGAVVLEYVNLFPLLRHDRRNVQVPIAVEVADRRVNRARERQKPVARKDPVSQILHPADLAVVIAELSNREVDVPIPIEVPRLDVGDAGDAVKQDAGGELLLAVILQDNDATDFVVIRQNGAHLRDEQVNVAIEIDVAGSHVGRRENRPAHGRFGERAVSVLADPCYLVRRRIAQDNIHQAILIKVDNADVANPRLRTIEGSSDRVTLEKTTLRASVHRNRCSRLIT